MRLKEKRNLYNMKVQGKAAGAYIEAAASYPDYLPEIINQRSYTKQQIFHVEESALCWKNTPNRTFLASEEKPKPDFKGQTVIKSECSWY